METSVEQLIKDRTFATLTSEELESVKELCATEEEFQTMKRFFQELETVSASHHQTIINPEVKNSLDTIFLSKYPGIRANWTAPETTAAKPVAPVIPLHQRTWVRVAAIALLVLGTAPFWNMLKTDAPVKDQRMTAQVKSPQQKTTEIESPQVAQVSEQPAAAVQTHTHTSHSAAGVEPLTPEASIEPAAWAHGDAISLNAAGSAAAPMTFMWSSNSETDKAGTTALSGIGTYPLTAPNATMSGFVSTVPPAANTYFTIDDSKDELRTLASFGKDADLNPDGNLNEGRMANMTCSLAEQPADLLDLLVPAF